MPKKRAKKSASPSGYINHSQEASKRANKIRAQFEEWDLPRHVGENRAKAAAQAQINKRRKKKAATIAREKKRRAAKRK